jgi:hypothetical protein
MKTTFLLPLAVLMASCCAKKYATVAPVLSPEHQLVYDALKLRDSLLFSFVFDHCDTVSLRSLISKDFEFYHDQSGINDSRADFLKGIPSLCQLSYKPRRAVVEGSLQVFPLYDDGALYGAIQSGTHQFFAIEAGQPERLTSTAVFTHLWILENGNWRLKRVLSYDHKSP